MLCAQKYAKNFANISANLCALERSASKCGRLQYLAAKLKNVEDRLQHSLSNLIIGYWAGLHGGPGTGQTKLDDAVVRCIAPNVFILRPAPNGGGTFCAAGSAVQKLFPEHLLRSDILDYWHVIDQQLIRSLLDQLHAEASPLLISAETRPQGGTAVPVELALMPVGSKNGRATLILGMFVFLGEDTEFTEIDRLWLKTAGFFGEAEAGESKVHSLDNYRLVKQG